MPSCQEWLCGDTVRLPEHPVDGNTPERCLRSSGSDTAAYDLDESLLGRNPLRAQLSYGFQQVDYEHPVNPLGLKEEDNNENNETEIILEEHIKPIKNGKKIH